MDITGITGNQQVSLMYKNGSKVHLYFSCSITVKMAKKKERKLFALKNFKVILRLLNFEALQCHF